jgi:micrococcal nuclease
MRIMLTAWTAFCRSLPLLSPRGFVGLAALLLIAFSLVLPGCSGPDELDRAVENAKTQAGEAISHSSGTTGGSPGTSSGQSTVYTVSGITDGDTIEVSPDAASGTEDVRLLYVDTPETYGGTEPLGTDAKAFTARKLEGEKVMLEYDKDRGGPYGRALARVRVVGQQRTIGGQLLSRGLAQTAFFSPNYRYKDELLSIQEDARHRNVGIWGLPLSEQCKLANRGNDLGSGSARCQR